MKRMNNVMQTQAELRKRKMMLFLPLMVIPFLTLAFWSLGGGKGNNEQTTNVAQGLNPQLPDAKEKEEALLDKLGFYNKADKDSAELEEWMRSDPYYTQQMGKEQQPSSFELEEMTEATASKYNQRLNLSPYAQTKQRPEDELVQKLALLQRQLEATTTGPSNDEEGNQLYSSSPALNGDIGRLENMMQQMSTGNQEDPEIKQLSNVMDKILDIKHPERVKERMKEKENSNPVNIFPVLSVSSVDTTVYGFFDIEKDIISVHSNSIEAVVNENQVLVTGAVIKLRLLQDIYVSGSKIPIGNFIYGTVTLNGERLDVAISSIRYGNSIFPVKMELHDLDGLSGIYIPGAITRDVVKQSTDNSLQLMELSRFDPSLKAQAAATGINTVKSLLGRKVKQVKVMVKAGYKVLLNNKV